MDLTIEQLNIHALIAMSLSFVKYGIVHITFTASGREWYYR